MSVIQVMSPDTGEVSPAKGPDHLLGILGRPENQTQGAILQPSQKEKRTYAWQERIVITTKSENHFSGLGFKPHAIYTQGTHYLIVLVQSQQKSAPVLGGVVIVNKRAMKQGGLRSDGSYCLRKRVEPFRAVFDNPQVFIPSLS